MSIEALVNDIGPEQGHFKHTIETSNAVIAAPWDKPMIPSYLSFDSLSDHHFT